ncbi:uncharacterized protein J3D65DRAFT_298230 [Phyllosticta citribraziliensis]|uniref:Uncharacterized protein n=1 Tax=Phyllosticta citribraziliensis TaxID=989973 RepID=A0ABR1LXA4_9PEZI
MLGCLSRIANCRRIQLVAPADPSFQAPARPKKKKKKNISRHAALFHGRGLHFYSFVRPVPLSAAGPGLGQPSLDLLFFPEAALLSVVHRRSVRANPCESSLWLAGCAASWHLQSLWPKSLEPQHQIHRMCHCQICALRTTFMHQPVTNLSCSSVFQPATLSHKQPLCNASTVPMRLLGHCWPTQRCRVDNDERTRTCFASSWSHAEVGLSSRLRLSAPEGVKIDTRPRK